MTGYNELSDIESVRDALGLLGTLLEISGQEVSVAVIGGSALLLGGYGIRTTRDVDIVAFVERGRILAQSQEWEAVERHASAVALELDLDPNWLNTGPVGLVASGLPDGFVERCEVLRFGGLTVFVADRLDLIYTKLYAATDQGPESKHMADLFALNPTASEIEQAGEWCRVHDPSPAFAQELESAVAWVNRRADD